MLFKLQGRGTTVETIKGRADNKTQVTHIKSGTWSDGKTGLQNKTLYTWHGTVEVALISCWILVLHCMVNQNKPAPCRSAHLRETCCDAWQHVAVPPFQNVIAAWQFWASDERKKRCLSQRQCVWVGLAGQGKAQWRCCGCGGSRLISVFLNILRFFEAGAFLLPSERMVSRRWVELSVTSGNELREPSLTWLDWIWKIGFAFSTNPSYHFHPPDRSSRPPCSRCGQKINRSTCFQSQWVLPEGPRTKKERLMCGQMEVPDILKFVFFPLPTQNPPPGSTYTPGSKTVTPLRLEITCPVVR